MKPALLRVFRPAQRCGDARPARALRRGRQDSGRRPEPRAADELPPGAAAVAHRRQPRGRAGLRAPVGRRPGLRRAHAPLPAGERAAGGRALPAAASDRAAHRPRCRFATAAPSAAASLTPTRSPSCRLAAALLDAEIDVQGPIGTRTLQPEDFFLTYLTTPLEPTELLTEVRFPGLPAGAGWSVQEFARRHGDFAIVATAAVLEAENGVCTSGAGGGGRRRADGRPQPRRRGRARRPAAGREAVRGRRRSGHGRGRPGFRPPRLGRLSSQDGGRLCPPGLEEAAGRTVTRRSGAIKQAPGALDHAATG